MRKCRTMAQSNRMMPFNLKTKVIMLNSLKRLKVRYLKKRKEKKQTFSFWFDTFCARKLIQFIHYLGESTDMYAENLQDNNEVDVDDSSEPNQSNPNASTSSSTANVQNEDDQANTANASQPQETQQIQAISASDSGSSGPSTPSTWRNQTGQQSQSRPQQVCNFIKFSFWANTKY